MGFIFLFLFLWERETLHFQKNIRRNQQTEEEEPLFFPQKNRGLSFSTLLAPQRTDPENLINRIKKIKKNQNSLGRNPGQLFFVYIKEEREKGRCWLVAPATHASSSSASSSFASVPESFR
jgi:hypothetical protein